MPWATSGRCRYYKRNVRVGTHVISHYVGTGFVGELAATADALKQQLRKEQAEAERADQRRWDLTEQPLRHLDNQTDLLWRSALLMHGYHKHGGQWRRKL